MLNLYKLGITSEVKAIYTGLMTTQSDFRKAINSDKIDIVSGSKIYLFGEKVMVLVIQA